jgi:hypothetical protein
MYEFKEKLHSLFYVGKYKFRYTYKNVIYVKKH